MEWAQAEALAFGSLLLEGSPIRLTGQDVERTFSQRHLVLHDPTTTIAGRRSSICRARARRSSCTQPAVRSGVLGIRIRLRHRRAPALVLWEAQYGDFANGAR